MPEGYVQADQQIFNMFEVTVSNELLVALFVPIVALQ